MIELQDLHFQYGSGIEALSGVSFKAQASAITAVLGPNGSGKSTCFKIISTQLRPQRGEVFVCGHSVRKNPKELRACLGVTFQSPALDPWLTVQENLQIHAALWSKDWNPEVLDRLGVQDLRFRRVKTLSGGQARRVELCKALMSGPKALLLDEPTTGLDPAGRRDFWSALAELRSQGMTVLVTTHLLEESELADHLVFLSHGSVAGLLTLADWKSSPLLRFKLSTDKEQEFAKTALRDLNLQGQWTQNQCQVRIGSVAQGLEFLTLVRELKSLEFSFGSAGLSDLYFEKTGHLLS